MFISVKWHGKKTGPWAARLDGERQTSLTTLRAVWLGWMLHQPERPSEEQLLQHTHDFSYEKAQSWGMLRLENVVRSTEHTTASSCLSPRQNSPLTCFLINRQ